MKNKCRIETVEIDGYYFLKHPGLYWHSGEFWYNEVRVKKIENNGSLSILLLGSKLGIRKLRKDARKCKIKLADKKLPF